MAEPQVVQDGDHYRVFNLRESPVTYLHVLALPNGKLVYAGNPTTVPGLQEQAIDLVREFREKEPPAPAKVGARRPKRPKPPAGAAVAEAPKEDEPEMASAVAKGG